MSSRAAEDNRQWKYILQREKNTYRLVPVLLEHVLGKVRDGASDFAVETLVLDSGSAQTQTAADEPFGLRVESLLALSGHDDPLLQVDDALGRVLTRLLWDLALTAWDARECQNWSLGGCMVL